MFSWSSLQWEANPKMKNKNYSKTTTKVELSNNSCLLKWIKRCIENLSTKNGNAFSLQHISDIVVCTSINHSILNKPMCPNIPFKLQISILIQTVYGHFNKRNQSKAFNIYHWTNDTLMLWFCDSNPIFE